MTDQKPEPPVVDLDELDWARGELPQNLEHLQSEAIDIIQAYKPMAAELRTLRARVGELEAELTTERGAVNYQLDARIALENDYAELKTRAESQLEADRADYDEARKRLYRQACEFEERAKQAESQLEAAREEQGLEAKVREVLGEWLGSLHITRPSHIKKWVAVWNRWEVPRKRQRLERVEAETLPALLRAILEVEAKGG